MGASRRRAWKRRGEKRARTDLSTLEAECANGTLFGGDERSLVSFRPRERSLRHFSQELLVPIEASNLVLMDRVHTQGATHARQRERQGSRRQDRAAG